jgi:hypothetical protein
VNQRLRNFVPFFRHEAQYNPAVMPVQCEIIEVAHGLVLVVETKKPF